MCARVLSLSRARVSALNLFMDSATRYWFYIPWSCASIACALAPDVSCTNTHTGRKTETRYESVACFFLSKRCHSKRK
jgi:hypothetical protein